MRKHILVALLLFLSVSTALVAQEAVPSHSETPQPTQLEHPVSTATPLNAVGSPSPTPKPPRVVGVTNWSNDTWTAIAAIVAFTALIQPWLLALWRRLFRRGTLNIHETALIEIGYSGFGPTIGLIGTFRAIHKDMFVQWVKLRLTKDADRSVREFEWKAFRNPKLSIGTTAGQLTEVAFEVPFSFLVTPLQPHRFNILFSDMRLIEPVVPFAQKLRQEWLLKIQDIDLSNLTANNQIPPVTLKKLRREFADLSSSEIYQEATALLTALNQWQAGKYQLAMIIQTARPDKRIQTTWSFTVSEVELEKLQNNVASILEEVCGLPISVGEYGFAYIPYNT